MAAMVTLGISSTMEKASCMAPITGLICGGESPAIILMSAPAAKTFSPPHRTTARTSSRTVAASVASRRSRSRSPLMAFMGGRSRRMVPTPSSTSSRTNSPTAFLLALRPSPAPQANGASPSFQNRRPGEFASPPRGGSLGSNCKSLQLRILGVATTCNRVLGFGRMHRSRWAFTHAEWRRLGGFGAAIALLHVVGWGLFALYAPRYPAMAGLGALAYGFGLRHAFDADHIAAIDNVTRKFLQQGKRNLGTGFFFSLGHSTVVFSLAVGLAVGARAVENRIPTFQHYGGLIGASVSGVFLWAIGILNLIVLLGILRIYQDIKRGLYDQEKLDEALLNRGFMGRFFRRFFGLIDQSWQMYPLGVLFGLGFDTATEVGLLAISAGVATNHVPFLAVLSLPLLFAAGMSLMDTADGAFMSHAYTWAFSNPVRKVYYNLTVTTLSVLVALGVGSV